MGSLLAMHVNDEMIERAVIDRRAQAREALIEAAEWGYAPDAAGRGGYSMSRAVDALLSARWSERCETCSGRGWVNRSEEHQHGGTIWSEGCPACNGSGTISRLALLEVLDDEMLAACVAEAIERGLLDEAGSQQVHMSDCPEPNYNLTEMCTHGWVPLYRQRETT